MKSLAREYMWWPGINKQIEELAQKCSSCAKYKRKPPQTPLTHWPWATRPMERLHVDFAEYKGMHLLVVIDAYSKYLWTSVMVHDTTTPKLLRHLDSIFADRGLPTTIVSDNGPQFTSQLFKDHMKARGIKHVLTPPYHPASNGLAEVAVGIVKNGLRKMEASASPALLQDAVTTMLFYYRMTPNTTTSRSPFELMDSNKVITPLSLLRPSLQRSQESLQQQRVARDSVTSKSLRTFEVGDNVLVYNKLLKINDQGVIVGVNGRNCYNVDIEGKVKLVSADDLQIFNVTTESNMDIESGSDSNKDIVRDHSNEMQSFSGDDSNKDTVRDDENTMQSLSGSEVDDTEYESNDETKHYAKRVIKKNYVIPQRRKYKTEPQKLTDGLPENFKVLAKTSKTRSGRSNN